MVKKYEKPMDAKLAINELANSYFNCPVEKIGYQDQAGGFSNVSNLALTVDNEKYLLRCYPESQSLASRQKETIILSFAADLGIAPKIFYYDQQYQFVLINYIEGKTLNYSQVNDDNIIRQVDELLLSFYNGTSPTNLAAVDLVEENIQFIYKLNNQQQWLEYFDEDLKFWRNFIDDNSPENPHLIHSDLNPFNIMIDNKEKLWLIDWTNAGLGHFASDYSMIEMYRQKRYFSDEATTQFIKLRNLNLVFWSLKEAQSRQPSLAINKDVLNTRKQLVPLHLILRGIIDKDTSLETATDFLELSSLLYFHYKESMQA